jgi:hypothetical protein
MKTLYDKEFYSFIPNDDNRGADGKTLRVQYANVYGKSSDKEGPCTMLEFFIGLSNRCNAVISEDDGYSYEKWFWEIMKNIGLDQFTDENFVDKGGTIAINNILDIVLERKYTMKGKGGLFPLKKTSNDQRKIEIWYQMMEYLNERYYI